MCRVSMFFHCMFWLCASEWSFCRVADAANRGGGRCRGGCVAALGGREELGDVDGHGGGGGDGHDEDHAVGDGVARRKEPSEGPVHLMD